MKLKEEKIRNLRIASKGYSDGSILMHEAIARKAGLQGTEHKYLGILMDHGPLTAGELAIMTGLTTGAVTGVIDRLEKKKLAIRQFDNDDRRKIIVSAHSQNAKKLLEPIFKDLQDQTLKLLNSLTAKELETIEKYFKSATVIMANVTKKLKTTKTRTL